ncbi:hypothetical protein SLEP1_g3002 [Rubroshorea leprosula]|uniref:Uncharacterized protein n=1 Tax=Rubroshorea leprosula TaxID=152421 RepID=A0AAV5HNB7_9ROSI|nr:hypothetical protein SLEP1_g3002 [Rubroshorea leprosula]
MDNKMTKDKNNKSLCGKSMKMVVSIFKVSSFSIANISSGASGPTGTKTPAPAPDSTPEAENGTSIFIHRVKYESDEMLADYIRKVHEKIQNDFLETSKFSPYIRK